MSARTHTAVAIRDDFVVLGGEEDLFEQLLVLTVVMWLHYYIFFCIHALDA